MKDIEETLKSINFARMSRIKDKMLADFLAQRRRERIYRSKDLNLDDLDMVVAAKGETHNLNETNQSCYVVTFVKPQFCGIFTRGHLERTIEQFPAMSSLLYADWIPQWNGFAVSATI